MDFWPFRHVIGRTILLTAITAGLCGLPGCATFPYPPVKKELFSWRIPRSEVGALKTTIIENGYWRTTNEDYLYMGALVTQYERTVATSAGKSSKVQIMLSFKTESAPPGYYRNLGLTIVNLERSDIPEINAEIDRIEKVLYAKLLELSGKENVVRGPR